MDIGALGKDFVAACSSMILKVRSKQVSRALLGGKKMSIFQSASAWLMRACPVIVKVKQQSLAADSNDKQPGNKANSLPRTSHVHGLIVMLERVSFDYISP